MPPSGPVSLPLHKLSFCTTATLHSKMLWEHLAGGVDLFAVFDHVRKPGLGRAVSEKQVLKLVRHGDLLEEIDLENLSYQVRLDEERYRSQQIQDSERYVILVIKRPAAALRYQLSSGEVRRIQMNFRPESGYNVALKVFRAIGVPVSDKNISPPASQGSLTRPVSQWSAGQQIPHYPVYHEGTGMKSEVSLGGNYPYHYGSSDLGMISNMDRVSSSSGSAYRQILPAPLNSLGNPSHGMTIAGPATLLPSPHLEERAATSYGPQFPVLRAPEKSPERPVTAPLTLTQLMPPRRELPFAKEPASRGARDEVLVEEAPQKSAKKPPVRVKAKPKKQPSRPSSSRSNPKPAGQKGGATKEPSMVVRLRTGPTSGLAPVEASPGPFVASTIKPANTKALDQVLTETSPNRLNTRTSKPTVATPDLSSTSNPVTANNIENISPEEYMTRLDHWIRKYQDLPAPTPKATAIPSSTDKENLAAYAAQTEEERLAALDTMICECLEDENFATLVADVEKSWKRIALGF
ncbi:MAG: hypothetical protein Q9213_000968 [Squamulea squamosa]